jgi:dihydrodipicolinate synthase/N-acetylneuraminate lyase
VLPSIGPDYGKAIDQAALVKASHFPTAMLLPMTFPFTDAGLATGIRRITDAMGKPAVVYIKSDRYLSPETLKALVDEGRVASIKYAVVRTDPGKDDYLAALCAAVDRRFLVSGIGERPAIVHLRDFGITSFTSGSVCLAPAGTMKLLALLKAKKYDEAEAVRALYMPFEDCRDNISPIRVLHDGVTLAGIADMGPMLPMLTGLTEVELARVRPDAKALAAADAAFMPAKAAA